MYVMIYPAADAGFDINKTPIEEIRKIITPEFINERIKISNPNITIKSVHDIQLFGDFRTRPEGEYNCIRAEVKAIQNKRNEVRRMEKYIGIKIVKAKPMLYSEWRKVANRTTEDTEDQQGYFVEYKDGYKSWSPKRTFEEAYSLLEKHDFKEEYACESNG